MPNSITSIGNFFKRGGSVKVVDGPGNTNMIELSLRKGDAKRRFTIGMDAGMSPEYIGLQFIEGMIALDKECGEGGVTSSAARQTPDPLSSPRPAPDTAR